MIDSTFWNIFFGIAYVSFLINLSNHFGVNLLFKYSWAFSKTLLFSDPLPPSNTLFVFILSNSSGISVVPQILLAYVFFK